MTERFQPPFIFTPGQVAFKGPFKHDDSHIFAFFVEGELALIQQTIDRTLNVAAAGQYRYRAVSSLVMVQFARLKQVYSLASGFEQRGKIRETDVITWVMLAELDKDDKVTGSFWHPVHIWVDEHQAVTTGREIYGYPKQLAKMQMPDGPDLPLEFALEVNSHQHYGTDNYPQPCTLFSVAAKTDTLAQDCAIVEFAAKMSKLLLTKCKNADFTAAQRKALVAGLLDGDINQVFLKQFPDASGKKAVYQAVVTTHSSNDKVHAFRQFSQNQFELILNDHDALPLTQTLGLKLGAQPVLMALYLHTDFTTHIGHERAVNDQQKRQKIAVIGGGTGSLTSVYHLTEQPNWQQKYDITVYQMGWRLGGKGASGRNAQHGQRIEEHGLHIWFGSYHNAFTMMQNVYAALERPPEHPIRDWTDAFKPHDYTSLTEMVGGRWSTLCTEHRRRPGIPGDGDNRITVQDTFLSTLDILETSLQKFLQLEQTPTAKAVAKTASVLRSFVSKATNSLPGFLPDLHSIVVGVHNMLSGLTRTPGKIPAAQIKLAEQVLNSVRKIVLARSLSKLESQHEFRHLFVSIDLSLTVLIGTLKDNVLQQGYDVLNDIDFKQWLLKHGANEKYTVNGAYIKGLYNLVFAYRDGDERRPDLEAGSMLRALLRMIGCYNGAFMYKMQGAMGDIIFEPIYQVLKARGVKFEFFQQVEQVVPQGDSIERLVITDQANGADDYYPLVDIKGIDCWPSEPNYADLPEQTAVLLKGRHHQLEIDPHGWAKHYEQQTGQALPQRTLQKGKDFDLVIFGASLASMPIIAPELIRGDSKIADMVTHLKTNATQAFQTWNNKGLREMGWQSQSEQEPVVSGFLQPFDTFAAMSYLLPYEAWESEGENTPKTVGYHCCVLADLNGEATEEDYKGQVKANATAFMYDDMLHLLPGYNDVPVKDNESRFYWRANYYGSERYVVSHVGSCNYRLGADETRYDNLYLAGDWTRNGVNLGCIEAAVNSGMMAARAICGLPAIIKGEFDL